jgi:predicted pyridoxine 5'-phosphate oxidase superfamily flavin-nucleotide-binding protein
MGRAFEHLTPQLRAFVEAQHMFVVATAPSQGGHVNVSPKGLDTFRVLDERTVGYLDLTGSGAETIAHLRENGRITLMFTAFDGPPNVVRLYGRGEVLLPDDDRFADLVAGFPDLPGTRAVIVVTLDRVSSSCGFAVPRYQHVGDRAQLVDWAERKGPEGMEAYRAEKNAVSIDGLPALPVASPRVG